MLAKSGVFNYPVEFTIRPRFRVMVREVINYPLSLVKLLIVDEDDQQFLQHKFGNAEFCS